MNAFEKYKGYLERYQQTQGYCKDLLQETQLPGVFKVLANMRKITMKTISKHAQKLSVGDSRPVFDLCFQEGVIDVFASTAILDRLVSEYKYRDDTLYYQLVTTAGVHRVYPGVTVPDNYDPLQEAW